MRDADLIFAETRYQKLFVDDQTIMAAGTKCAFFEPLGEKAVGPIVDRISEALSKEESLSLVRVGNGEGNAISMVEEPGSDPIFDGFDFEFVSQNGLPIGPDDALSFSRAVVDAIKSADIQGYRILRVDEEGLVRQCLGKGALSPALGITYARALFHEQLCEQSAQRTWFTNAWIHFDLMKSFDALVDRAKSVSIITGRHQLEGKFRARLGSRLDRFVPVPVQGHVPKSLSDSHFGRFEEIRSLIRRKDQSGSLFLIGAGLFGKNILPGRQEFRWGRSRLG